eukprot:4835062-Amphidinium_carterae.1
MKLSCPVLAQSDGIQAPCMSILQRHVDANPWRTEDSSRASNVMHMNLALRIHSQLFLQSWSCEETHPAVSLARKFAWRAKPISSQSRVPSISVVGCLGLRTTQECEQSRNKPPKRQSLH